MKNLRQNGKGDQALGQERKTSELKKYEAASTQVRKKARLIKAAQWQKE